MSRFFNTAGPNRPEWHYTLPILARVPQVFELVSQRAWFVVHAPRQSGKTTAMLALAAELTVTGRYAALYGSCEAGAPFRDDPRLAAEAVIRDILRQSFAGLPEPLRPPAPAFGDGDPTALASFLSAWCRTCPLPVVLLLDEIDALQDEALVSVLRQLRSIYSGRPTGAPASLALIGLRDVRDYKVASGGSPHLGTASPFNISVASITLRGFTRAEVATLYGQHTAASGQAFSDEAIDRAWYLTRGQPWLVNALAREVVGELKVTGTVEAEHIDLAKERLILARSTHLDSLADKLNEPRVRRVIAPMLSGDDARLPEADLEYCVDLGLLAPGLKPIEIANPIYREVLPRQLAYEAQVNVAPSDRPWSLPDGRLDLDGLLRAFVDFWRQHGEWMIRGERWPEAAHQIVLMAFLQRLINGGGYIEREYGLGRGRIDLLVRWAVKTERNGAMLHEDRHALELKVWRDTSRGDVLAQGLAQLDGYLDRLSAEGPRSAGAASGTLVLFDARTGSPTGDDWAQRGTLSAAQTPSGRTVRLLRA